jgi:hypothetical protein
MLPGGHQLFAEHVPVRRYEIHIIHIFRKPSSGEALMGKKFMEEIPAQLEKMLEDTKKRWWRKRV